MTIIDTPQVTTPVAEVFARAAGQAKKAKRAADTGWANAETDCIEAFISEQITTYVFREDDDTLTRVTIEGINESRMSVDEDVAFSLLNTEQIAAITKTVIDVEALRAAVTTGLIPERLAAQFTNYKAVKSTARITFGAKK